MQIIYGDMDALDSSHMILSKSKKVSGRHNILYIKKFHELLRTGHDRLLNNSHRKQHEEKSNVEYVLSAEGETYLFTRWGRIYMRSRQRTWRRFKDLIPEKGSSSLRENLKAKKAD